MQTIDDLVLSNFSNIRTSGRYVEAVEVPEGERRRVNENPSLAVTSYLPAEDIQSVMETVSEQVSFVQSEIDDTRLPEDVENLLQLQLALVRFGLDWNGSTTNLQNGYRPMYKFVSYDISKKDVKRGQASTGWRICQMFDSTDEAIEELALHYSGTLRNLVNTVETCEEENNSEI